MPIDVIRLAQETYPIGGRGIVLDVEGLDRYIYIPQADLLQLALPQTILDTFMRYLTGYDPATQFVYAIMTPGGVRTGFIQYPVGMEPQASGAVQGEA